MHQMPGRLLGVLVTMALLTAACGGDDAGSAAGDDTGSTSTSSSTVPTSIASDDTTTTSSSSTTTTTTTTTTTIPSVDPDRVHEVVVEWADGTADPLDVAQRIFGFPLEVPVPEGSTPHRADVRLFDADPGGPWVWDWSYQAFAPGPIDDVDIRLEGNGPGSIGLRERYDPIMAELGWGYSNSTGSDPGEPGGPNSINHVYVTDDPVEVAGVEADAGPMFVWLDEDLVFGDEENPGYRVDVTLDLSDAVIPVPLLGTLAEAMPPVGDAELLSGRLATFDRPPDSFLAEEGLRYLDAELVWRLPAGSVATVQDTLLTELDGEVLQRGEESFFDEGTIRIADPTSFDGDWQLPVIVVGRYEGTIDVAEVDGAVFVTLEVTMEPNRELLGPPVD